MFSSSSLSRRRVNPDGSYNIYCWSCSSFISRTLTSGVTRSLCAVCHAVLNGESIPDEALLSYEASKGMQGDVGLLVLAAQHVQTPERKFSMRSMTGEFLHAVGSFLIPQREQQPEKLKSVHTAKEKRRGRLFDGVTLGSLEEIDQALKKDK